MRNNIIIVFTDALALYVGLACMVYGFAKVFELQFMDIHKNDSLKIGELTGMQLTWYYFGYSKIYQSLIGWFQVIGGVLLLWSRSRILGCLLLLPILTNIVLIDYFYHIYYGAFVNAVFYFVSIIILLVLQWKRLVLLMKLVFERSTEQFYGKKYIRALLTVLFIVLFVLLNNIFY